MSSSVPRLPGRPRNAAHSDAAKTAALELLKEQGYAAINMETVSQRTGISRQTLYRRWPHKRALILDAFADQMDLLPQLPDTGQLHSDLKELLGRTITTFNGPCGATNRVLVAEGLQDDAVMAELREQHFAKRRAQIATLVSRAQQSGEDITLDLEVFTDLLLGPVWYRLLFAHAPLTPDFAAVIAQSVRPFIVPRN